ncbi:galactofuranosylgalactofuranosylrhamnosyl-N-acetylglucosaminyl-diphospho-decaprenol beta-1,5/1,6-galactofuranosyltransferase [Agromyces terreus]|uniref:Galactofuranosylgalactofuranosylrhamnosyl-N-acetylglucosaminyl-diphospho-decaprenol beta-1,5/1,6-galactofuranosyltransferase n=1 Tax=Agromyces terreus TaxID=424795 RepID=A0A9X2KF48_9MICO|nr:glycosyltransferase [Agromyces terreus]MCP2371307.1 galactofuranosylgalactofuranosylrhamnosyl-N-acetylglucosaminyl-diphospho-decaprenol beta-1,5/1,6-galactofuranosyltransferase [Agromyces terreus]
MSLTWNEIQRVVFPEDADPDVISLYVDADVWAKVGEREVRVSDRAHLDDVLGRDRFRVAAGDRVSFASYFNAFPASYWQQWTNVQRVRLTLETSGEGTLLVYRSTAQGVPQRVASAPFSSTVRHEIELPIVTFGDGGWYWFDIVAGDQEVVVADGRWETDAPELRAGGASIGTTTFNKPDYCVRTLEALAADDTVREVIDRIYIVDQGNQRVVEEAGFDAVAERLGETLTMIEQPNLGGSGGFARSMSETLSAGESDFIILLDDDVTVEPESIARAVRFARRTTRPVVVGGHMFDLLNRPVLHAFAETVDLKPFVWHAQPHDEVPHDFRFSNLRQTRWMHARMDADYNGWWFCLIPTEVVREVGLSLPAFIKWDDAEYCLRARDAGYPTVTLPGMALWHVSWLDKDDSIDWQAYFHARNRYVAALLHSPYSDGGLLTRDSERWDLKHLLSMQYYPVTLRHRALRDILSGPAHMQQGMATILGELRAAAADFPEKTVLRDEAEIPMTVEGKRVYPIPSGTAGPKGPRGVPLVLFTVQMTLRQWFTRPASKNIAEPQVELAKRDGTWFRLPHFDSALVSTADGSGKVRYTRDPKTFRRLLRESRRLHREIKRRWPELAREYRAALPEITSPEAWEPHFTKKK